MLGWWRRWRERRAVERAARARADADAEARAAAEEAAEEAAAAAAAPALTEELDLHTFQPRECADVVEEYVRAAQEAGFRTVRIVHGKGKGTLRRTVHGVLGRHPAVRSFALAGKDRGGWGATMVELVVGAIARADQGGNADKRGDDT